MTCAAAIVVVDVANTARVLNLSSSSNLGMEHSFFYFFSFFLGGGICFIVQSVCLSLEELCCHVQRDFRTVIFKLYGTVSTWNMKISEKHRTLCQLARKNLNTVNNCEEFLRSHIKIGR